MEQVLQLTRAMMPLDTSQTYYDSNNRESIDTTDQELDLRPLEGKDIPNSIKFGKSYPKGALIFVQGQPSKSVYLLTKGKVKLSTCSPVGKVMIVQIAGPGDILGLSSALCGAEHETSAEVLDACHVECVKTSDFLKFLRVSSEACLIAAKQLSSNYQKAHRQICALGLSDSVFDRVAKLFLSWSGDGSDNGHNNGHNNGHSNGHSNSRSNGHSNGHNNGHSNGHSNTHRVRIDNFFTHEEIAGMIGSSRETVTRTLKALRERDLITIRGREAVIHDRRKLMAAIGTNRGYTGQTDF